MLRPHTGGSWQYHTEPIHNLGSQQAVLLYQEPGIKHTFSALVDCTGSVSAPGRRYAEPEAGVGDEEPANPPAGEEDHRAGKAGELVCLLPRLTLGVLP